LQCTKKLKIVQLDTYHHHATIMPAQGGRGKKKAAVKTVRRGGLLGDRANFAQPQAKHGKRENQFQNLRRAMN
jgi:hypothetical protein